MNRLWPILALALAGGGTFVLLTYTIASLAARRFDRWRLGPARTRRWRLVTSIAMWTAAVALFAGAALLTSMSVS